MAAENILQTLQRIATLVQRLDRLAEDVRDLRTTVSTRLDRLESQAGIYLSREIKDSALGAVGE